jgi:hypothetical protein
MIDKQLSNEEKLDAIYKMTSENQEILKSIRRQGYISGTFRVLYWLMVIGFVGGTYYYIRPFIGMVVSNSSKIEQTMGQLNQLKNQLPETKLLNQLLEGLQKSAVAQ